MSRAAGGGAWLYGIAACVGLPQRCYVFPRYENVCAAYDLCALPAVRVANSAKHNSASVFMRASFVDFSVELISLPNELVTTALAPQLYWTHDISSQAWLRIDCA